jgi:RNA polymerase sigma-70 factor (ECF subfamily)
MARQSIPIQDSHAFSRLYERSYLTIFRYIYGLVGGPVEEVEDITADTYVRAWKGRHRFSGDDDAAINWLMTISRNLVIDRYRRRKYQEFNLDDETIHLDTRLDENNPPEQQVEIQQEFLELWKRIQLLPIAQRELIALRFLVGWRVNRIAQHRGIPENTVSVQLKRILENLRQGNG